MSKTVASTKFRKVNVDEYDPEKFADDTPDGEEQGPNEAEVNNCLAQYPFPGKHVDALNVILKNAPVGAKNESVKDRAVQLAIRVLTTFKAADIDQAVKGLDSRSLDILMKYIYRGFEFPSDGSPCASLLTWHEK
ncbi:ARPC5-like protein, partial [Mya arenaria]